MLLKIIILSAFVYLFKTYYLVDSVWNLFNPIKTFEVCYCTHFIIEKTKEIQICFQALESTYLEVKLSISFSQY